MPEPFCALHRLAAAGLASCLLALAACAQTPDPGPSSPAAAPGAAPAHDPAAAPQAGSAQPINGGPAPAPLPPATGKADGTTCIAAAECGSGICEGQGCDDAHPGTCQPSSRMCTYDLQPYCGCDGLTFQAGGNCAGRRFASRDACAPTK